MSIHFITGKPGAGKGVIAMQQIENELVNGDRPIICAAFAVRLHPWLRRVGRLGKKTQRPEIGLQGYLMSKYGRDFDCLRRVYLLDEDQAGEFYLRRVGASGLITLEAVRDDKGRVESFSTDVALGLGGVVYILDESWKFFGSRNWQNTGKGVLFYAAQHRKLGDDWFVVTQNTKQIDVALRIVAQDFWVVTNHGKLKAGVFKQPAVFSVAIYGEAPTGARLEPMERKLYKLDKAGLGGCFDTAAGVGVAGVASADIFEKTKGVPWWGIFIVIALVGYLVWQLPHLFGKAVVGAFVPVSASTPAVKSNTVNQAGSIIPVQVSSNRPSLVESNSIALTPSGSSVTNVELPTVVGLLRFGNLLQVALSDGTVWEKPDVTFVNQSGAVINGQVYLMNKKLPASSGKPFEPYVPGPIEPVFDNREREGSKLIIFGARTVSDSRPVEMTYPAGVR